MRIVFIVYYYPPINSSGAKRVEALSKYLVSMGHHISIITTRKTLSDGEFTEAIPPGVDLIELDSLGRDKPSCAVGIRYEPMFSGKPSWRRRIKDWVMQISGQLPDPRLPFAFSILSPWLAPRAKNALRQGDLVIGSAPPWPMLLAALLAKKRFGLPCILDYRDHFSECHEMPGGRLAKWLEKKVDRWLVAGSDQVVAISKPMTSYYQTFTNDVATILNGYDHEVLDDARLKASISPSNNIVIRYMGIVSPGRIPYHFLDALMVLQKESPEKFIKIRVEFYGNAALIEKLLQEKYSPIRTAFLFLPPVPYKLSLQRIIEADFLLFCETSLKTTLSQQGILTTKLFEYIGSGRPILADISPDTLAGELLLRCNKSHAVGNSVDIFLQALREEFFYKRQPDQISELAMSLSRKVQAEQYAALAAKVVNDARV